MSETQDTVPVGADAHAVSEREIRAALYFAVGVASEGSLLGRNVSYQLSFAGYVHNEGDRARRAPYEAGTFHQGQMEPVFDSGYSVGTLQTDLGQQGRQTDRSADVLLDAYQQWARDQASARPELLMDANELSNAGVLLARRGNAIRADPRFASDNGYDLPPDIKNKLGEFLRSDAGVTYVHGQDVSQVTRLMSSHSALGRLQLTDLYMHSSADDQLRMVTVVGKLANQAGDGKASRIVSQIDKGLITSLEEVKAAVPAGLHGDRDNALRGAELLIALRNSTEENPLHNAWQHVAANPLVNPTQLRQDATNPNLHTEYNTVKNLFLIPAQAKALVESLDEGSRHAQDVKFRGAPADQTAGLYASGHDLVQWNRDGQGSAYVDGRWQEIDRAHVSKVTRDDGTVDLSLQRDGSSQQLLQVPPAQHQNRHASAQAMPSLLDASHPANGIYEQAYRCVAKLDEERGATPGEHTQRFAAGLTTAALASGMTRIDHVVLSDDAARGWAVQGDLGSPLKQYADVDVMRALQTPLAQSSQEATVHVQAAEQRSIELSQQQARDAVTQGQAVAMMR